MARNIEILQKYEAKTLKFIQPILFDWSRDLIPFLESYFQMKPLMINAQSNGAFRIIIQYMEMPQREAFRSGINPSAQALEDPAIR
mmetsp:Transcript_18136/g.17287  ORF Transcript_18136/g.17287 Transcript_18136/m.17287 type:complete len:86 (-) Transcript_18136:153-410(-)